MFETFQQEAFCDAWKGLKSCDFAQYPAGGTYDTCTCPLVGWGGVRRRLHGTVAIPLLKVAEKEKPRTFSVPLFGQHLTYIWHF